jgi:hypothetical protein
MEPDLAWLRHMLARYEPVLRLSHDPRIVELLDEITGETGADATAPVLAAALPLA